VSKAKNILTCPAWYFQVAEEMVRNNSSLKQAALDLDIKLDPDEVTRLGRKKDFQEILRIETNKYHAMVANDPTRTKSAALGRMWVLADRLEKNGEYEKSAQVLDKLAKMEGWAGNEGNINIFSGLTQRDIEEAKERIAKLPAINERSAGTA
jgi:hypothetical protein